MSDHPSTMSAFEQIKHEDEQGEFWYARELGKLLGYDRWENFAKVIVEAIEVCTVNGGDAEGLFRASTKKSRGRDAIDYRLTRHACYIIAESADGRKSQVALAKIYFALTTQRYELLAQSDEERRRIEYRQRLLRENAQLALLARSLGAMTPQEFARFFNSGYRGLYREIHAWIHSRKELKRRQHISDYMGSVESAANIFRAALASQLIIDRGTATLGEANAIHFEAGDSIRSLLISKGIYPERLPTPKKSYQQLLREEEARQQLFAEQHDGLWAQLEDGDDVPNDTLPSQDTNEE